MSRSSKKGPFVEERLMSRIEADERGRREADDPHLVAHVHGLPGDGRAHDRRPRRPQARAGVHHRADGRPQARRVRADADSSAATPATGRRGEEAVMAAAETRGRRCARRRSGFDVSRAEGAAGAEHIRGRSVPEARTVLAFSTRAAAREIENVLRSAVANAEANHGLSRRRAARVAAYADEGPTIKRWRAARARPRRAASSKRTCHITILLAQSSRRAAARRRKAAEAGGGGAEAGERPRPRRPRPRRRAESEVEAPRTKPKRRGSRVAAKPKTTRRDELDGTEDPSRRPARRRHPRLEVELVHRQEGVRGVPARGRQDPRAHLRQALPRRPVRHPDPQGQAADHGRHLHGPAGHRDRQVRGRGRRAAA